MSQFDGTGEKKGDGGDSGAFKGRRHPFLERRVDWKKIDRVMKGGESGDLSAFDKIAMPMEVPPFQLINEADPTDKRVEACVAAVKQLSTNMQKWYVIRDCLIAEYKGGGPDRNRSKKALSSFIRAVNQRLAGKGEISADPLIGTLAEEVAAAEGVAEPELSMHVRVRHTAGTMGPIGVCFTNTN